MKITISRLKTIIREETVKFKEGKQSELEALLESAAETVGYETLCRLVVEALGVVKATSILTEATQSSEES